MEKSLQVFVYVADVLKLFYVYLVCKIMHVLKFISNVPNIKGKNYVWHLINYVLILAIIQILLKNFLKSLHLV